MQPIIHQQFSFPDTILNDIEIHYYIMLVIVIGCYFIIQPVITFFVNLQSIRLLTYVISSLLILFILCLVCLVMDIDDKLLHMIKITFQCLAIFGGCLALAYTIYRVVKRA